MASHGKDARGKDEVLTEEVVSKFLDFQNSNLPAHVYLQLLHPARQKAPDNSGGPAAVADQADRQQAESQEKADPLLTKGRIKICSIVFVIIAWILLALNILAIPGNFGYGHKRPAGLNKVESSDDWAPQIVMLVVGSLVLGWTTWLCLKKNLDRGTALPALVAIALILTLISSIRKSGDGTIDIQGFGRSLSGSLSDKTTAIHRFAAGIFCREDKPSDMPVGTIVHEGDSICGVKIVKIYRDKVEFEKDGKRWIQAVEKKSTND